MTAVLSRSRLGRGRTTLIKHARLRTLPWNRASETRRSRAMTPTTFQAGSITFEWDATKARSNRRKHGVSFEEGATVFLDPLARVFDDPVHSLREFRFVIVGRSLARRDLVVVHVERGDAIRIISARLATRAEREQLERGD